MFRMRLYSAISQHACIMAVAPFWNPLCGLNDETEGPSKATSVLHLCPLPVKPCQSQDAFILGDGMSLLVTVQVVSGPIAAKVEI